MVGSRTTYVSRTFTDWQVLGQYIFPGYLSIGKFRENICIQKNWLIGRIRNNIFFQNIHGMAGPGTTYFPRHWLEWQIPNHFVDNWLKWQFPGQHIFQDTDSKTRKWQLLGQNIFQNTDKNCSFGNSIFLKTSFRMAVSETFFYSFFYSLQCFQDINVLLSIQDVPKVVTT